MEAADVAALDDQGRPALTINTILPTINTVVGEQSTRRADIRFKPRGSGMQKLPCPNQSFFSNLITIKWNGLSPSFRWLVQDRGWFDVRLILQPYSRRSSLSKDPLDIIIDPDAKEYDPRNWNEIFETKWMSIEQIEEQYGQDKADQLRVISEVGSTALLYGYMEERYGDAYEGEYSSGLYSSNPEAEKLLELYELSKDNITN